MPEGWSSTPLPGPDKGQCIVVTSSGRCSATGFSRNPSRSVYVCVVHWNDDGQMIKHYDKSMNATDFEAARCFADRHNKLTVGSAGSHYLPCSHCGEVRGISRKSDDSLAVCSRDWRSAKALEVLRERYLGLGNFEASNILAARLKVQIDGQKSRNATYEEELKRNPARKAARRLKKRLWEQKNHAKKATSKQAAMEAAAGEGSDHPSSDQSESGSSSSANSDL